MESAHVIDALPDLFSEGLPPAAEAQVRQHLSTCPPCRQIYEHYKQDQQALDHFLQTTPYLPVADRLLARTQTRTSKTALPSNIRKPALKSLSLAPFALVLLVTLAAGVVALRSSGTLGGRQSSFATGGIGMTKAEWEKNHKFDRFNGIYVYDNLGDPYYGYNVSFWHEGDQSGQASHDAPIWFIGLTSQLLLFSDPQPTPFGHDNPPDLEKLRVAARAFLPSDAELREAKEGVGRRTTFVEIYHSKSLETRYPPLPSIPNPWRTEGPGTIVVSYSDDDRGYISSVIIRALTSYTPHPPPPTPSMTPPPLPTPLPTKADPSLPTPESTPIPDPVPTTGTVQDPVPTPGTIKVSIITRANLGGENEKPTTGYKAPDFEWTDALTGKTVRLSSIKKPVLVNFWGTWCPPCRAEMPEIQKMYDKYKGQVEIIGVSMGPRDDPAVVNSFLNLPPNGTPPTPYTWRFIHDSDSSLATRYEVGAVPSSYFLGADGVIRAVHVGAMSSATLEFYLRAIINPDSR